MKITRTFALAAMAMPLLASSATAAQGSQPRNYFRVQLKANAELQTSFDGITKGKLTTNDVINGLLDDLELIVPSGTTAAQCDIIACYADNEDILDQVTYYLVRTRGPKDGNFKVPINPDRFDTDGGTTVFNRKFSFKSSSVKVAFQDADTWVGINLDGLTVGGYGLTKGNVAIKGVNKGETPRLFNVNASLKGYHSSMVDGVTAVGTLDVKFGKPLSNSAFDALPDILIP